MNALRVKALVLLMLMVVTFGGTAAWRPTVHLADTRPKIELESLFPKAFGDWVTDERQPAQLVSPDVAALLDKIYNQTLSRTYVNSRGDRIMLSVAYGGDQSDATRAHLPEVCYPAQGFQIMASQGNRVLLGERALRVRQLVARLGGRNEPITYWTIVGERVTVSGTEQKLAQLSYSTRGVIPDGMLVRVSNIDTNAAASFALHDQFIDQLSRALPPAALARVMGIGGV